MRKFLVTTTAVALTLLAGVAVARADDVTTPTTTMSGSVNAERMIGRTVVNASNEKVGEIDSVLIDSDGRARYVVVGVGGFLGVGERDVAIRWDALSFANNNEKVIVNATKDQLSALPAHRFPDPSWKGKVYAYGDDLRNNPYLRDSSETTMATTGSAPATSAVDARKLIGRNIRNGSNDEVGAINSVLIEKGGTVKYVVVGVGGLFGFGQKQVALPWDALTFTENGEKVTANVTKEQLKVLPEYQYADPSRRGTVYSYDEDLKTNPYLANSPTPTTATPPLPGANSFTESQARERIEANGYTAVTKLKKDEQSIWRGTAMKDGKPITVALDYKGNVVAQ
jgi:sporulation protein YlmC with PRC-barrel domain